MILHLACCGEKVQFPDAKKSTFRRKRVILLVAQCGEKVHLADANKCTFGGYGVIFPSACCGKKVHIPVERLDFACLLLLNAVFELF